MNRILDRMQAIADGPALARVCVIALAALCVAQAVRIALLMFVGPALPLPDTSANAVSPGSTAGTAAIADWHLFGSPATVQPALATSTLVLTLRGTFATAEPGEGLAFIAGADGRERSYAVGDTLPGDAVLEAVHVDHVVVRNGTQRERLPLSGRQLERAGQSPQTPTAAPKPVDPSGGFLTTMPVFGSPDLATARAALTPAVAALMDSANVLPVSENGRLIGVRLRVSDPALLERVGLRADDTITAVNGIPLDGPERRTELEATLRAGGVVTLTVRRDGTERPVSVGL
jgi:general secretion pathway protein C